MRNVTIKLIKDSTVVGLKQIAKDHDVPQAYKMNRAKLEEVLTNIVNLRDARMEVKCGVATIKLDTKERYRNSAAPGTLVAFRVCGKLMTAKIVKVKHDWDSCDLEVHTKNGTKIHIDATEVLWFKTGARWPKSIFDELKGFTNVKE